MLARPRLSLIPLLTLLALLGASACQQAGGGDKAAPVQNMRIVVLGSFGAPGFDTPIAWSRGGRILATDPTKYETWLFENGGWRSLAHASPDGGEFLGTWLDDERIIGWGHRPNFATGITLIDASGTHFITDLPNTSDNRPIGRTKDGVWWSMATQGISSQKVLIQWPEADPSQRAIVGYYPMSYVIHALNPLGDYLVRDDSSSWRDPGYAMLAGKKYPDEVTWGQAPGITGGSVGITDDGTVLGQSIDAGLGFLHRDGSVDGFPGYDMPIGRAISPNGDYLWMTGDAYDQTMRWTHGGKVSKLHFTSPLPAQLTGLRINDAGQMLFTGQPKTTGSLVPIYLVSPAEMPNPLGETSFTLAPAAAPGAYDLGPTELYSQNVTLSSRQLQWQAMSVSEGHADRSFSLGILFPSTPQPGTEVPIGASVGPGGQTVVLVQWAEANRPQLSSGAGGTVKFEQVDGRTLRVTLTDIVLSDGQSDVMKLSGTLQTRGALLN